MRSSRSSILTVILVSARLALPLAAMQAPAGRPTFPPLQAPTLETNGTVSGKVWDTSHAFIPGVTVRIRNIRTDESFTVQTDDSGSFWFPRLRADEYELAAGLPGFKTTQVAGIRVQGCQTVEEELTLQIGQPVRSAPNPTIRNVPPAGGNVLHIIPAIPGSPVGTGSVSGIICHPTQGFIRGATVRVTPISVDVNAIQSLPPLATTTASDQTGAFTLSGLPVGTYTLTVMGTGIEQTSINIRIVSGSSIVQDVHLKRSTQP